MAASAADHGPFALDAPQSIHLQNAPLDRVLCQVRWPELTGFAQRFDAIGESLGSALAKDYPLFAKSQETNFVIGPNGIAPQPGTFVYQWSSADGQWSVHFAATFVTIETARYTSKEDLLGRLRFILSSLQEQVAIPLYTRIGYRYTNRVSTVSDINSLIKPQVRGGGAVPVREGAFVVQSVTETLYSVDQDKLLARWAQLPAGATVDPAVQPLDSESWVLDLDAFTEAGAGFHPDEIVDTGLRLARRGYAFFVWSVTPQFLKTFGAEAK
ncbi:TIGR04255 family protein [Mycolicibacterium sp.]|uniref:TIGR04255 family protein n=1 Tax=Mycolicibacterium sp. TaxID=2320850 RepID=UPI001A25E599|nr:TIGR04255 family protein [Mycolicibacterium sp.]MBJ7337148.1 TIGR04255 family protein [Mycolicibacterium sp.]